MPHTEHVTSHPILSTREQSKRDLFFATLATKRLISLCIVVGLFCRLLHYVHYKKMPIYNNINQKICL